MAKELLARGQATITTHADAYTLTQSVGEYIYPATCDGSITNTISVSSDITVTQGDHPITAFSIGVITKPAGFSSITVDDTSKRVTFIVTAHTTTLADHGKVDIPVTVAGTTYHLTFVWSKAKSGMPGTAGTDANLLDWVREWNSGKTLIDQSTVITPKLFAGVKHADGTLTGTAVGRYAVAVKSSSGTLTTETVDGICGFKDGLKTFILDNGGNAQLGRGDQYIKYNAATGRMEFGAAVSLQWAGATYIDKDGLFTGTLSATAVSTVHLDASQITSGKITADHIDVAALKASLITTGNIEALTLNVVRGKVGGWSIDADSIFRGVKNNTSGVFMGASGAITLGSNGLRGYKWRLDATGAGAIAGGNILWDAAGNVVFAPTVSLQWSEPLASITAALGGTSYSKLTQITAQGIYTGSLAASQITAGTLSADRIAAGSLKAEKLDATSMKATLINTEYINGLDCTFVRGTIGGWMIGEDSIAAGEFGVTGGAPIQLRTVPSGAGSWHTGAYRPYGISMMWHHNDNAGHFVFGQTAASGDRVKTGFIGLQMMNYLGEEYFCLSVNARRGGSQEIYNRIAGWGFDHQRIWKNDVSLGADGSITNTGKWKLSNDGSGQIASGNISWDAAGHVTFTSSVSLSWTAPISSITAALGGTTYSKLTKITPEGIYTGNLSAQQITTGMLAAERIDAADIKSKIVNTDYINGLSCTFVQGKIGGWKIASGSINQGYVDPNGAIMLMFHNAAPEGTGTWNTGSRPMGTMLSWYQPGNAGHIIMGQVANSDCKTKPMYLGIQMMNWLEKKEYFCLSANYALNGSTEIYNRIAGWAFDHAHIWKNSVSLGTDGSLTNGTKWQMNNDGSGRIASGNIRWDAAGNVTFSQSVSVIWTAGIQSITAALGGATYPKMTQLSATGIYTGKIGASQINVDTDLIVGGSSYNGCISVRDSADVIMAKLDRSGITAKGGSIGGWDINATTILASSPVSGHRVCLTSSGYLYNDNTASLKDYWGLKPDGSATFGYGTISFAQDGSGYLANQNIKWDTAGNVTMKGSITATAGKIAGFTISGNKLLNTASDSSIEFSSMIGNASLSINNYSSLLSMRADSARTGISIQTYATGAIGISIIANTGSKYAIESYGPMQLGQRANERWNVPGVLYIGSKYSTGYNNYFRKIWGDGVTISSFAHTGSGQYKVTHNLNHTNYTVMAFQFASSGYHGSYRLIERAATYFVIQNMSSSGGGDSAAFDFIIFGKNTW